MDYSVVWERCIWGFTVGFTLCWFFFLFGLWSGIGLRWFRSMVGA